MPRHEGGEGRAPGRDAAGLSCPRRGTPRRAAMLWADPALETGSTAPSHALSQTSASSRQPCLGLALCPLS